MKLARPPRMIRFPLHFLFAYCLAIPLTALSAKLAGEPGSILNTPPDMTYYARQGDTLSGIAQRYTGRPQNWGALAKRNKIADDRAIPVGTAILIPLELLPEEASAARVTALAGLASAKPVNGEESPLELGSVLQEGTQIITGKNGFLTLTLPDDSRISIPSNSQVGLSKLRKTRYTASPRTEITLLQGKIESRIAPLSTNKGRFEVRSPLAVAGVRGTHFRVGLHQDGVANEVLSGAVAVGHLDKPQALLLPAGKGNIIRRNAVGQAAGLLPPPQLNDAYRLQERTTLQFGVADMPDAAGYRVQLARDADALDVLAENRYQGKSFKFDGLDDGQYFIRVTAIDAAGLEGLPLVQGFTLKARPEPPFTAQPKNKVRAAVVDFVWTEAAQAQAYHLQVARDAGFQQLVLDRADLTDVQFSSEQLSAGSYFWRVATIARNKTGLDQGPYSDAQGFVLMPPQTLAPLSDSGGNQLAFGWASEPGQKFLVQIGKDAAFRDLYLSRELEQAELTLPRPVAGQYFIRVRATDADGYVGAFSATQKLNIYSRWVSSDGEPVHAGQGMLRAGD
ncbi:MAG: FecR domain-containing protein [Burkholderiales bacterium]|nr:FecR domain-containing protein [Burkholderiales bacterium]